MNLVLRLRARPERHFVTAWLEKVDGAGRSSLLCGDLGPEMAEALALHLAGLGVAVEREANGLEGATALPCPQCHGFGVLPSPAPQNTPCSCPAGEKVRALLAAPREPAAGPRTWLVRCDSCQALHPLALAQGEALACRDRLNNTRRPCPACGVVGRWVLAAAVPPEPEPADLFADQRPEPPRPQPEPPDKVRPARKRRGKGGATP